MTPEQLRLAAGCSSAAALVFAEPLTVAIARWHIANVPEFVAQVSVESQRLRRLQENLTYTTPERLMQVWPSRFPTLEIAQPFANNPEDLANQVYGGRLGNTEPGDGWRYRGRGLIQLTGRANYAAYQAAANVSCVNAPDLLLDPVIAADSAGWYWAHNNCDALAGDIRALTKRINGAYEGLAARIAQTATARGVLDAA